MQYLISGSISHNTKESYKKTWLDFQQFLRTNGCNTECAGSRDVANYICHLFQRGAAHATIATKVSALSFYFKLAKNDDPTDHFLIRKLINGAKQRRPSLDTRDSLTELDLRNIILGLPSILESVYNQYMVKAILLMAFHFCLRVSEYTSVPHVDHCLKVDNVTFQLSQNKPSALAIKFHSYKHSNRHGCSRYN